MGIETDRFLDQNAIRDFLCSICLDVVENPIQCPLEHIFCTQCIQQSLRHTQRCPEDHLHLSETQLVIPSRHFRNGHSNLQIKCKFVSRGCIQVQSLETITHHESNCDFRRRRRVTVNDNGQQVISELRDRLAAVELTVYGRELAPNSITNPESIRIEYLEHEVADLKRSKSYYIRFLIALLIIFALMIGFIIYDTYGTIVLINRDYNFTAIREAANLLDQRVTILQNLLQSLELSYENAKKMITELLGDYWTFKEEILNLESNMTQFIGETKYDLQILKKDDNATTDQIKEIWTTINEMKNDSGMIGINYLVLLVTGLFAIVPSLL